MTAFLAQSACGKAYAFKSGHGHLACCSGAAATILARAMPHAALAKAEVQCA